jgi:membrane protein DedA with SNARE-associated domain
MFVDELILKQLGIILISAVKFILAAPASYLFGFSYTHTIISTTIGGWIGVLSFFYGGRYVFSHFPQWKKTARSFYRSLAQLTHNKGYHTKRAQKRNKPVKIFTRRNRFIVKIRTPLRLSRPGNSHAGIAFNSHRYIPYCQVLFPTQGSASLAQRFSDGVECYFIYLY